MIPISTDTKDWYRKAMAHLLAHKELLLMIGGSSASALRKHLMGMSKQGQGAGFASVVNLLRYRSFHRLFFTALAGGLGVAIQDAPGDKLMVMMNAAIGHTELGADAVLIREARRS